MKKLPMPHVHARSGMPRFSKTPFFKNDVRTKEVRP
jgi:hypothetical protein